MSISIDLGNVWDMFSAIGTVGAVVLSLSILRRENRTKISVLIGTKFKTHEKNGIIGTNCDEIIQVSAYNSGKLTVGLSFIGFGVGVKRKNVLRRFLDKEDYEISTYISTLDKVFDVPELEMIQPGQVSKEYEIDRQYLYKTSRKYINSNGDLLILSVFKDIYGKNYYGKIMIQKPTEK